MITAYIRKVYNYANFGLSKNDMHDGLQRITSQYGKYITFFDVLSAAARRDYKPLIQRY